MINKKSVSLGLVLFTASACGIVQALASDPNRVEDPGFEQQTAGGQGGWILFDKSRFSSELARSGEQSMYNFGLSKTVSVRPFLKGTVSGSFQTLPASGGSRWQLTGYGMTPTAIEGAPAFGIVQLSFFDVNGMDLGTIETNNSETIEAKISNKIDNQATPGDWRFLDTGIATAPAGTVSVQAFTLYVDYSGSGVSQGVYFDDLRLCELDQYGAESSCEMTNDE